MDQTAQRQDQHQQQWQGEERRSQRQSQYQGDDRRRPDPLVEGAAANPSSPEPGMESQKHDHEARLNEQQENLDHNRH